MSQCDGEDELFDSSLRRATPCLTYIRTSLAGLSVSEAFLQQDYRARPIFQPSCNLCLRTCVSAPGCFKSGGF
ncbi:hypothetical protein SLE2022_382440 [Rubroshorea leprosula]